jgi:hypothetical protein
LWRLTYPEYISQKRSTYPELTIGPMTPVVMAARLGMRVMEARLGVRVKWWLAMPPVVMAARLAKRIRVEGEGMWVEAGWKGVEGGVLLLLLLPPPLLMRTPALDAPPPPPP